MNLLKEYIEKVKIEGLKKHNSRDMDLKGYKSNGKH